MSHFPFQSPTGKSPQPTDEYLEDLLAGYALSALTPEETAELESYLAANPDLRQKVDALQEVMGLMAGSARMTAPPHLRSRILAIPHTPMLKQTPLEQPPQLGHHPQSDQHPIKGQRRSGAQRIGAAIAALLLVTLGVNNYLLYQRLTFLEAEVAEHQASESNYTFELKSQKAGSNAVAKVVIDIDAGELIVGVRGLPPLSAEEAYYLWAFTANQKKIFCGRFNTDASGQLVEQLSVRPEEYSDPIKFMRISREPVVTLPNSQQRVLVLTSES
jgi:anti-sigma-K factor RskA